MDELIQLFSALAQLETAASETTAAPGPTDSIPSSAKTRPRSEHADPSRSTLRHAQTHARFLEETSRLQRAYLRLLSGPPSRERETPDDPASAPSTRELEALLRRLRLLILRHPVAAQEAYAALLEEGRRFAGTERGLIWKRRLAGSQLLQRARRLLDVVSMRLLEDDPDVVVPTSYVDAIAQTLDAPELEQLLLRVQGVHDIAPAGGGAPT